MVAMPSVRRLCQARGGQSAMAHHGRDAGVAIRSIKYASAPRPPTGDKKYLLEWSPDRKAISSNDNASFYQSYLGYPIIAVLLQLGVLSFDPSIGAKLGGIHWKALNTKHTNATTTKRLRKVSVHGKSRGCPAERKLQRVLGVIDAACEEREMSYYNWITPSLGHER